MAKIVKFEKRAENGSKWAIIRGCRKWSKLVFFYDFLSFAMLFITPYYNLITLDYSLFFLL